MVRELTHSDHWYTYSLEFFSVLLEIVSSTYEIVQICDLNRLVLGIIHYFISPRYITFIWQIVLT